MPAQANGLRSMYRAIAPPWLKPAITIRLAGVPTSISLQASSSMYLNTSGLPLFLAQCQHCAMLRKPFSLHQDFGIFLAASTTSEGCKGEGATQHEQYPRWHQPEQALCRGGIKLLLQSTPQNQTHGVHRMHVPVKEHISQMQYVSYASGCSL
jgi:hypothetical protein